MADDGSPGRIARLPHPDPEPPLVALVGPCTSGKSTLKQRLLAAGYRVRAVAQEHSYVPDMWLKLVRPDLLIYLHVSIDSARRRRQIDWGAERLAEQAERLAHARAHADLVIDTDALDAEEVFQRVLAFIEGKAEG